MTPFLAEPTFRFDGAEITVQEVNGYHWLDFSLLFPRMVARGLLPAVPPSFKYRDDPQRSPALQMLHFFHDSHAAFKRVPRIKQLGSDYLVLHKSVALVCGVPFIACIAVEQVLLQQPYLSQEEFDALDEAANELSEALRPVIVAEPSYSIEAATEAR